MEPDGATAREGSPATSSALRQHPALEALEPRVLLDGTVEPVIPLETGFLGASIPSWWVNTYETTGGAALAALADTGANFVGLTPTWYQDTLTSNAIEADADKTASDAGLVRMIADAHAADMLVMLKPHVDVWDGSWRGFIAPGDVDAWFASYENFIVHYAEIAQANQVELFVMGTELAALSGTDYQDEWTAVANAVMGVYGGTVTYAANHDEYQDVSFWDAVHYVGLDAYFDLGLEAPAPDASYDDILAAWDPFVAEVDTWMATDRPSQRAIITEIGYRSIEGAHIRPWESWRVGTYDEQAQADCYRAALEAWTGEDYLDALAFWAWPVDLGTDVGGDGVMTGYSPYGKAAEDVLREYTYHLYPPDLVTEITVTPRCPLPGETVTVEVTTRNTGPGPAAPVDAADFQTMLFLRDAWSFDPSFTADIVGQRSYTDIPVGGEQTFTATFTAPLTPGRYHVGALADANGNVIEGDEDNNLTAVDLWVNLAPVATAAMPDVTVPVDAAPTLITLPDDFNDPDITGSVYRFVTNMGTFDVHMFDASKPITVGNFRLYADAGDYVDSIFHRSMPEFIVQSGGFIYTDAGGVDDVVNYGMIENEPLPYISNVRGTLAPAKLEGLPNSASNGWFINLADNGPNLDYQNGGFCPFGEVVGAGMDVADAIAALKVWNGTALHPAFTDLPLNGYSTDQALVQEHFVYFSSISQIAPLAFEVTANTNPALVTAAVEGDGTLRLTYAPGVHGTAQVTVRATDLCGATVEQTFDVFVGDTVAPRLEAWYSAAVHGETERLLEIPDDASFSEPRSAGIGTLVLHFSEPVNLPGVGVTLAGRDRSGAMALAGITVTVSNRAPDVGQIVFTPALPDCARYLVRLVGVTDLAGNALAGNADRVMTALLGDVTGDWRTDMFDLIQAWDCRGQTPQAGTEYTRADVDRDGLVAAPDLAPAWENAGRDATGFEDPAPAAPAGAPAALSGPDLLGTGFSVDPDRPIGGTGLTTVQFTVANQGQTDTTAFWVDFYLSDDQTITAADAWAGYHYLDFGVAGGGSVTESVVLNLAAMGLPKDPYVTDNQYWLGMIVDSSDQVTESDETNNANLGDGADQADVSSEGHVGATGALGAAPEPIGDADVTVAREIGDEWLGAADVDLFEVTLPHETTWGFDIDADEIGSDLDAVIHVYDDVWIPLGVNDNGTDPDTAYTGTDPYWEAYLPAGTYYVAVRSAGNDGFSLEDLDGRVESTTGPYDLLVRGEPAPDLLGTYFDVDPDAPVPGTAQTQADFTVANQGAADAEAFWVDVYLSDDPTITPDDYLVGWYNVAFLAAGGTLSDTIALDLDVMGVPQDPFVTDNQYWIGMIVDGDDAIAELNETNNANQGPPADMDGVSGEAHVAAAGALGAAPEHIGTAETTVAAQIGDEWIGAMDVDLFEVDLPTAETWGFDIDAWEDGSTLDAAIHVYDAWWTEVGWNDDGEDPETGPGPDPYWQGHLPAGTYYVAVRNSFNDGFSPADLAGRADGTTGPYELHVQRGGASPVPGTPDLLPGSDTGRDNTDNITSRDNTSAPDQALSFEVAGTVAGATVTIYAADVPMGSAVGTEPTTIVTTWGTHGLADGAHAITARQTVPGQAESGKSAPLAGFTVDTTPPAFDAWFSAADHGGTERLLEVAPDGSFSEPRSGGLAELVIAFSEAVDLAGAFVALAGNDADGAMDLAGITADVAPAPGNGARITFTPALPDAARYLVRLEGVVDVAGNAAPIGDDERIMTALAGDVNQDLEVDVFDLLAAWDCRGQAAGAGTDQTRSDLDRDGLVAAPDLAPAWAALGHSASALGDPVPS